MQGRRALTHQRDISSYSRLVRRVNSTITAPTARRERQASLKRSPDERQEDWDRLLDEIEQADNVTLRHSPDGTVQVIWTASEH